MMSVDFDAMATRVYGSTAQTDSGAGASNSDEDVLHSAPKTNSPVIKPDTNTTAETARTTDPPTHSPYTLALPEDALLEASAIERTATFAKAARLSPEAAQQALEHANSEVAAYRDGQMKTFEKLTRETWVTEAKSDPEIGGEKFTGSVTAARQFLKEFGDTEVTKILDDTGWGNNRHVIRMLSRAMNRMSQAGGGGAQQNHASVLYGNTSRS